MKPQPAPRLSVSRSLTAMMLMAASSLFAQTEDLSGQAHGYLPDPLVGLAKGSIPEAQYRRGAIGHMITTASGAFTLTIQFPNQIDRQTGVLKLVEESPPDDPRYEADLGTTSGGFHLKVYRLATGEIILEWLGESMPNGGYAAMLSPAVTRSTPTWLTPGPARYNTVSLSPDYLTPDGENQPTITLGKGYGTLIINNSGASAFAGKLPDGQSVTGGGQMVGREDFHIPLIIQSGSGRDTVVGYLPAADQGTNGLAFGSAVWVKGPSPHDVLAPTGWKTYVTTSAGAYKHKAGERVILGVSNTPLNAFLALWAPDRPNNGNIFGFTEKFFTLTANHKALFPAPNSEKLQVNFVPATGFFTGKVKLHYTPPMQPKTVSFSGMIRQHRFIDPIEGETWATAEAEGFYLADPLPGTINARKVSGGVMIIGSPWPAE